MPGYAPIPKTELDRISRDMRRESRAVGNGQALTTHRERAAQLRASWTRWQAEIERTNEHEWGTNERMDETGGERIHVIGKRYATQLVTAINGLLTDMTHATDQLTETANNRSLRQELDNHRAANTLTLELNPEDSPRATLLRGKARNTTGWFAVGEAGALVAALAPHPFVKAGALTVMGLAGGKAVDEFSDVYSQGQTMSNAEALAELRNTDADWRWGKTTLRNLGNAMLSNVEQLSIATDQAIGIEQRRAAAAMSISE